MKIAILEYNLDLGEYAEDPDKLYYMAKDFSRKFLTECDIYEYHALQRIVGKNWSTFYSIFDSRSLPMRIIPPSYLRNLYMYIRGREEFASGEKFLATCIKNNLALVPVDL